MLKCNLCSFKVNVFEGAFMVEAEEAQCSRCGSRVLTAAYSSEASPFPGKKSNYTGCLFCDAVLSAKIDNPFLKAKEEGAEEEKKETYTAMRNAKREEKRAKALAEEEERKRAEAAGELVPEKPSEKVKENEQKKKDGEGKKKKRKKGPEKSAEEMIKEFMSAKLGTSK